MYSTVAVDRGCWMDSTMDDFDNDEALVCEIDS